LGAMGAGHQVADGGDLLGELLGPGRGSRGDGRGCLGGFVGVLDSGELLLGRGLGGLCTLRVLEFRAQPADEAAFLFGRLRLGRTDTRPCS
jgi:hypothetical protein